MALERSFDPETRTGTIGRMDVTVLLLCAGSGRRFGGTTPKTYVDIAGEPLLVRCLTSLTAEPRIRQVQPVIAHDDKLYAHTIAGRRFSFKLHPAVHGGAERADSMACGLAALEDGVEWVAVHDAARPMPSPALLADVLDVAERHGAAVPGIRVTDTIKLVDDCGKVRETLERGSLRAVQTPQVARKSWFIEALKRSSGHMRDYTDDASILEAAGFPVYVSQGDSLNRKVTTREDVDWLIRQIRRGGA